MGCSTALNKMACMKQQWGHAILQIQLQLQLQLVQVQMSLNNGIKAWKQDFKIVVSGGQGSMSINMCYARCGQLLAHHLNFCINISKKCEEG